MRSRAVGFPIGLALLAGCGGSGKPVPPLIACQPAGDSVIYAAVESFLTTVTPKPRRFLIAIGTDSALPDAGRAALQRKGPTFLYPTDTARQSAVRSHLASIEDAPTLLVTFGGVKQTTPSTISVRVAGRFVGGANDGRLAAGRLFRFDCDTARWRFKGSHAEQVS